MSRQSERRRRVFACQECGYQSSRWMGFCPAPSCNSGSPLVETEPAPARSSRSPWVDVSSAPFEELAHVSEESYPRLQLPSQELNRVLGGGLVPGSVVLLAGEPGVGKSTLLLQIAQSMASVGRKVLYACGEESSQQIKLRSQRLGFDGQGVFLLPETDLGPMLEKLEDFRPEILMVDSIQTIYSEAVPSGPGSVAQVREAGLAVDPMGQNAPCAHSAGRAHNQGWLCGRPTGAGAHGGRGGLPGVPGIQRLPDTPQ